MGESKRRVTREALAVVEALADFGGGDVASDSVDQVDGGAAEVDGM